MKPEAALFMLNVVEMDRAVAFWRDVVGLAEKTVSPYWSEMALPSGGDAVLALHPAEQVAGSDSLFGLWVADADAASDDVADGGGRVIARPEDRGGFRLAFCGDTEGNAFMLSDRK